MRRTTPRTMITDPAKTWAWADKLTPDIEQAVDEAFDYTPWDAAKQARGAEVRFALASAVKTIIKNVPPCSDRTVAIRKIREARMDCNSALTHDGKY
jgi:hypothetical protein